MKGVNELTADELLMKLSSFREISKKTGWESAQILNYIDNSFRYEYPQFYIENLNYFCWGQTNSERDASNKKAYVKYLKIVKEELLKQQLKGKKR